MLKGVFTLAIGSAVPVGGRRKSLSLPVIGPRPVTHVISVGSAIHVGTKRISPSLPLIGPRCVTHVFSWSVSTTSGARCLALVVLAQQLQRTLGSGASGSLVTEQRMDLGVRLQGALSTSSGARCLALVVLAQQLQRTLRSGASCS
jgi:hypothetical protein